MTHAELTNLLATRQDTYQPAALDQAAIQRLNDYRDLLKVAAGYIPTDDDSWPNENWPGSDALIRKIQEAIR